MVIRSESDFWQWLKGKMTGYWDADRVENVLMAGMPDVSYGIPKHNGWIELKFLKELPKRRTTPVKIPHWTVAQKTWLMRRGKISGDCWMMCCAGEELFLFSYDQVPMVEVWTKVEWRRECRGYWTVGAFDPLALYKILYTTSNPTKSA